MTQFIYKNRQLIDEKQAQVSINERAFLFGDGVFETCKIFNGKIYDYKSHKARLEDGLKNLKIIAETSDLEERSLKLIAKNNIKNGTLRISISRGIGSQGYLPTNKSKPLIIIWAKSNKKPPKNISLGLSTQTTPLRNLGKTNNALPYILTKIEAQEQGIFDCLMLSNTGKIAESSSANIFWVKNGKIFTADETCGILLGTIRQKLIEISPFQIYETKATLETLEQADEIFLTNSTFLALSINEFMGKKLPNNFGKEFLKLLEDDVKQSCKN